MRRILTTVLGMGTHVIMADALMGLIRSTASVTRVTREFSAKLKSTSVSTQILVCTAELVRIGLMGSSVIVRQERAAHDARTMSMIVLVILVSMEGSVLMELIVIHANVSRATLER